MNKIRVAVVFGGRSAEHEVSILSARNVVAALDRERFEPILIGIGKDGRWLLQDEVRLLAASRDPRLVHLNTAMPDVSVPVHVPGGAPAVRVAGDDGGGDTAVDVVFPVLHGPMGEDGTIQGLFEVAGLPYVGAGVLGSAVGMDKDVMKRLLAQAGLPIVPHVTFRAADWKRGRAACVDQALALGGLLFVKPANMGSSVGVSRATDRASLEAGIDDAFQYDHKVIVERGIDHPREVECAVLGNDDPVASVPGEIVVDHPDGFYSYTAKYIDESGATVALPARLSPEATAEVQRIAIATFKALDCAGLARVDLFVAQDGGVFVNEINTLPGFTAISMYPKMWEASGLPVKDLVTRLIELAIERGEARKRLKTTV